MSNIEQTTTQLIPKEPITAKRIPYGIADYGSIRAENAYYVDKTHFIHPSFPLDKLLDRKILSRCSAILDCSPSLEQWMESHCFAFSTIQ